MVLVNSCIKIFRTFSTNPNVPIMKFLNVAEKNDAAKNIAFFLSGGNSTKVLSELFCLYCNNNFFSVKVIQYTTKSMNLIQMFLESQFKWL